MFFRHFLNAGPTGDEQLDRPITNFDIIGIPTGSWSSSFFSCYQNIFPSCCFSFFFPYILWSQIVVRSQIPFFISLKNYTVIYRKYSGYNFFINFFLLLIIICAAFLFLSIYFQNKIFYFFCCCFFAAFAFVVGHTRTAFKEKYEIAGDCPAGWGVWEMISDAIISLICMPCALSQMARHVFQYDKVPDLPRFYMGDPTILPPLDPTDEQREEFNRGEGIGAGIRPARADEAGLHWVNDTHNKNSKRNTGADHRQADLIEKQRSQIGTV